MKSRVYVIGLDGATWRILGPLVQEGTMPNLERLIKEGSSGILESTIPPETAPAWVAFQTGVNPGKSGIYDFFQYDPEKRKISLSNAQSIKVKTIWELVSAQRRKIISINVPMTYPPREVNGIIISGLMSPGITHGFVYPSELYDKIVKIAKHYEIIKPKPRYWVRESELEDFISRQIEIEKTRFKLANYLMSEYEWDLFMVHNQALDTIQHACWKYIDNKFFGFSSKLWLKVKKFYEFVDKTIGEVIERLSKDDTLIIVSDHGFGPLKTGVELNCWLQRRGYLVLRPNLKTKLFYIEDFVKHNIAIRKLLEGVLNKVLSNFAVKGFQIRSHIIQESIDWNKTKALMTGGYPYANIYINAKGSQKKAIISSLIRDLKEFKNPYNNEAIVEKIYGKQEIYNGPFLDSAPDLVVKPVEDYIFFPSTNSLKLIRKEMRGTHRSDGIFVVKGPSIRTSYKDFANIIDIVPTILTILGLDIPMEVDGRVIKGIFRDEPEIKVVKNESFFIQKLDMTYSEDEDKKIRKRLEDLGYF